MAEETPSYEAGDVQDYDSGERLLRVDGRPVGYVEPVGLSGAAVVHPFAIPSREVPSVEAGLRLLWLLDGVVQSGGNVEALIAACERLRAEDQAALAEDG